MTRPSLNIHYPLYIPTCLPTAFVLLCLFGSISISLKEGAYEFKFPILMPGGWILRLGAFVNTFVSTYCEAEVFSDYSIRLWKSRMGKKHSEKQHLGPFTGPFGEGRESFSPQASPALPTTKPGCILFSGCPTLSLIGDRLGLPRGQTTSEF